MQAIFQAVYLLCILLFVVGLGHHHLQLIQFPLPLSYNEASGATVTGYIASGGNPYAIEAQPARTSVYPILFNLMAAPLTPFFGNTLVLHRVINGLLLLGCAALFYRVTYRYCRSHFDSLAATALLYCGFMVFSTPLASPNGIGLILFFGAIFLPLLDDFSKRSLLAALVLGVATLHAKQYFVASLGFMALLLFLNVSKRSGIYFGLCSVALSVVVMAAVLSVAPYYLDATLFAVSGASDFASDNKYMWPQWAKYLPIAAPVIGVLCLGYAGALLANRQRGERRQDPAAVEQKRIDVLSWHHPLLPAGVNPLWLYLVCCIFIFTVSLGRNPGNDLTYLFQLVSPFLLALAAYAISLVTQWRWFLRVLLLTAFVTHYNALSHDFEVRSQAEWQKLETLVAGADAIYATPIILELIADRGIDVYNNGHTSYFMTAQSKPAFLVRDEPAAQVGTLWAAWVEDVHTRIRERRFDLLLVDFWTQIPDGVDAQGAEVDGPTLLRKHYRVRETLDVAVANRPGGGNFPVQIWEPRRKPRD